MIWFKKKVITRVAPSPTGFFHLGTARTALFNFLYARHYGGKFLLRIEDTDKERSRKEYEDSIFEGLAWLGLSHDGFSRQSERTDIYKKYLEKLIADDRAYFSKEESGEGKRGEVIRLRNKGGKITFRDEIRGDITFDTSELGDFIIAKSLDEPLYNFAVVVDDADSGVTHVIRGEDHIPNTPRQILIAEAIGAKRPVYAHLPLILAPDRSKLSKRHGALSLVEYDEMGYLPEAMVNFLALLGWSPQSKEGGEEEILSLAELVKKFDLNKVGKSAAIFNIEKLDWINKEYLKKLPPEILEEKILNFIGGKLRSYPGWSMERFRKIIPTLIERIVKLSDIARMASSGEIDFFFKPPEYETEELVWKKDGGGKTIKKSIGGLMETIDEIPENVFSQENIKAKVIDFIGNTDRGSILWPMRYALSGLNKSPDPFLIAEILGKTETIARLRVAASKLGSEA